MIGWYVHHRGSGHGARAGSVAAALRHPVTGLGSGGAPDRWPGRWVDLSRDDDAPAPVDVTAHGTLHWVPRHDAGLADRTARIADWVARAHPALLVVDVSVEVSVLARLCGVPVVVVALPGRRVDPPHRLAYDLADALLAPWPAGTHETEWPEHWRRKLWAVGAVSRVDGMARRPTSRRDAPRVLLLWGTGGRSVPAHDLRAARAATPGWEWVEGSGAESPEAVWALLHDADVVVTHAGQNAVAEVAAARRPAVVVAEPRPFGEQVATSRVLERRGAAVGLEGWPEPAAWPRLLERARALGGDGWAAWSTGDGAARAARHLDTLADTLTAEAAT